MSSHTYIHDQLNTCKCRKAVDKKEYEIQDGAMSRRLTDKQLSTLELTEGRNKSKPVQ